MYNLKFCLIQIPIYLIIFHMCKQVLFPSWQLNVIEIIAHFQNKLANLVLD